MNSLVLAHNKKWHLANYHGKPPPTLKRPCLLDYKHGPSTEAERRSLRHTDTDGRSVPGNRFPGHIHNTPKAKYSLHHGSQKSILSQMR